LYTYSDQPWGLPSYLCNGYRVFFPRGKRQWCDVTTHPHLKPRLKKEYSYASAPLWAFMAGYRMNFTFLTHMAGEWLQGVERLMVSLLLGYVVMPLDD
jgi:hypothetical protein